MTDTRKLFCATIAKLVQPDRAEEAAVALEAMLPMLSDMDPRAFSSRECINRIVTAKRRTVVPAYADMRECIATWVRDNPPQHAYLEDQTKADWAQADHSWLRYWQKMRGQGFREEGQTFSHQAGQRHVASLIRQYSPKAYAEIAQELGA